VADTEGVLSAPAAGSELADRLEIEWVSTDPLATEMAVELALAEGEWGLQAFRSDPTDPTDATRHEHDPDTQHQTPNIQPSTPDTAWLACRTLAGDPLTEQIVEEVLARSSSSVDGLAADGQTVGLLVAEALTGNNVNSLTPGQTWPELSMALSWPDPWRSVPDRGGHPDIAEPVDGELLVMATEPPPSTVLVSSLPEGAPGFARAATFRPNGDGELTWTQATAYSSADGPQLALVMLGSGVWNW
jgi:hypothetical protein